MRNEEFQVCILPDNEFYDAQERMRRYLLSLDDDVMLYHFRKACGRDTKGAQPLGGWEAEECKLKGHTTGHYLSALALCYHATGDERIREKASYMVREMALCQQTFARMPGVHEGFLFGGGEEQFDLLEKYTKYPEIWAPYYTLHKIMAGLLDCYEYLGDALALEVLLQIGSWVVNRLSRLPEEQRQKMWSMYIAGEFGGLNEVMARLAAYVPSEDSVLGERISDDDTDSKRLSRESCFHCAHMFDNPRLFTPLMKYQPSSGGDGLDGLHANQHIPQIIGALEIYKATGEEKYLNIAHNFWETVTKNRSYAPGGVGEGEMFRGFREIAGNLTEKTMETCASYNMLKLTKALYKLYPDSRYMDYYERTLYNHILATPAPDDSGESTYFFPLNPGGQREFLRENSCCHGTGMENHFRYGEAIYHKRDRDYYINLYIPSSLTAGLPSAEQLPSPVPDGTGDEKKVSIRIERISQRKQHFRITASGEGIDNLYIRKPAWAGDYVISEREMQVQALPDERGFIRLLGDFRKGCVFDICWDPQFSLRRTPDDPKKAAVCYGPYVLAAACDGEAFLQTELTEDEIKCRFRPVTAKNGPENDRLHYQFKELKWIPLYEIGKIRYHVYVLCT